MGFFKGRGLNISNGGSISINGKTYKGNNIQINNGQVIIDGKVQGEETGPISVTIHGDVENVECDGSVTVNGNVKGNVDAGNSIRVEGDVHGDVDAGNSVQCGDVKGKVDAGNTVKANNINMDTRRSWF